MIARVNEFLEVAGLQLADIRARTAHYGKKKSILKKMDFQQHAFSVNFFVNQFTSLRVLYYDHLFFQPDVSSSLNLVAVYLRPFFLGKHDSSHL